MFAFLVACTEVDAYLSMKYFLKTDETFMKFRGEIAKALIHNSYIYDESCTSPAKTRKRNISHILETAPTHATEYGGGGMGLHHKI